MIFAQTIGRISRDDQGATERRTHFVETSNRELEKVSTDGLLTFVDWLRAVEAAKSSMFDKRLKQFADKLRHNQSLPNLYIPNGK